MRLRGRPLGVLLLVLTVALPASAGEREPGTPSCFGAASRDPRTPCHNAALRFMVRPRPSIAEITPNEPCDRLPRSGPVHPCAFGVDAASAVRTVALIGDSHASHWRAALHVAALARHWRGISITSGICPVSEFLRPAHGSRRQCVRWNRAVVRWLTRHPEVSMVVHAQINSRTSVAVRSYSAEVRGYRRIWKRFPPSVRRIAAIRDDPFVTFDTAGCVMRARARRERPGRACALSRAFSLRRDPLARAASTSRSRRVDLVDLTRYFCGQRRCYPVVGGALVHKDTHHLTRVFARTLGPYLLRRLDTILAGD
ncbi:MAG TPA: SGNH hydrolase domain-containing protein [Solirubrobacteraceae bacterium]|nr:SGNH hydrolase domain-containing protein [Solirubrobacteraceae bacterium]